MARFVDAPIADVIDLSNRHELRKLFVRTDAGRWTPNAATAKAITTARAQPTPAERLVQLINNRYEFGPPPSKPMNGTQALTEIMGRRWTDNDFTDRPTL